MQINNVPLAINANSKQEADEKLTEQLRVGQAHHMLTIGKIVGSVLNLCFLGYSSADKDTIEADLERKKKNWDFERTKARYHAGLRKRKSKKQNNDEDNLHEHAKEIKIIETCEAKQPQIEESSSKVDEQKNEPHSISYFNGHQDLKRLK